MRRTPLTTTPRRQLVVITGGGADDREEGGGQMCGHKLPDSVRCVWLQSHVASKTGVTRPADGAAGTGPGRVGGKNDTS